MQVAMVPWTSAAFRLPVATWRRMIDLHYPGSGWIRVQEDTLRKLQLLKAQHGLPTFDATVAELLGATNDRGARRQPPARGLRALPLHARLAQERDPDTVRIVYPPAINTASTTFGSSALSGEKPELDVEVRYLQASGERHQAIERRAGVGILDSAPLEGEITLEVEESTPGSAK